MHKTTLTVLAIAGLVVTVASARFAWSGQASSISPKPSSTPIAKPDPDDRAAIRRGLLERLDAQVDEMATRFKLEARLAIDAVLPVPYLGVDADFTPGGFAITAIYADTGAERAGLRKGDLLVSMGGARLDSKAALARAVRSHHVGDVVRVEVTRDGAALAIETTLGPRPEEDEDEDEQFPDLIAPLATPPAPLALAFDDETIGSLPARFTSYLGGHGRPGAWTIVKSERGLALRQSDADTTGIRFPMAILRDFEVRNVVAHVRFRYVGGHIDKAAGLVLRFRDPGNYLVARANAAEGDLRIFRIVNGDRRTLPGAIAKGATDDTLWHDLEFRAEGPKLTAILDGKVRAESFDTFFTSGRVGLWTKSDSQSEFDDLAVEALK